MRRKSMKQARVSNFLFTKNESNSFSLSRKIVITSPGNATAIGPLQRKPRARKTAQI